MNNDNLYKGLKPGQYMQIGGSIKSVTDLTALFSAGTSRNPSPQTLAGSVSWVFIALRKRRSQINQTPISWHRGETELENEVVLEFDPLFQMARIDKSVELNRVAYLHKLRSGSGRMVGLRWLDPDTITPDDNTVDRMGYSRYFREVGGHRIEIPADDIIRIYLPGLRELAPDVSAGGAASLDAQIVRGMAKTLDGFFEGGGLPVLFIDVPGNPLEAMIRQMQDKWQRILRREGDGVNKMLVTSGGATVTTLSLAPEQLDTSNIDSSKAEAILATFGVPAALVHKDVNRAEAELKAEQFADDIVGRLRLYMRIINNDVDVQRTGLALEAHPERMEVYQRRELLGAEALQRLTGRPIYTVNEARHIAGMEPITNDPTADQLYVQMSPNFGQLPQPAADIPDPEPSKAWQSDMAALRTFVKKGNHWKRWFNSNELDDGEIMRVILELDPLYAQVKATYP